MAGLPENMPAQVDLAEEQEITPLMAGLPENMPEDNLSEDEEATPLTARLPEPLDEMERGIAACSQDKMAEDHQGNAEDEEATPATAAPESDDETERGTPTCSQDSPASGGKIPMSETFFVFDYDDTILPSTWLQRQGLRLDSGSQPSAEQRQLLAEVAVTAGKILRAARQHGTVILVTNAERGWIELSSQKFIPTVSPLFENVKMVSARTSYEGPACSSPLDWKLHAFEAEINRYFTPEVFNDASRRKNVLSLGDSAHEREALMRATSTAPNCFSKSLKFVERPDISQICKQHELITNNIEQIVHHEGNLDLCVRCP